MNESDRFAQADQQVSTLKDRIARQREAVKQAKLIPTLTMSDRRLPNRGERWT